MKTYNDKHECIKLVCDGCGKEHIWYESIAWIPVLSSSGSVKCIWHCPEDENSEELDLCGRCAEKLINLIIVGILNPTSKYYVGDDLKMSNQTSS